jgi:hypothetical protein
LKQHHPEKRQKSGNSRNRLIDSKRNFFAIKGVFSDIMFADQRQIRLPHPVLHPEQKKGAE